jgi:L-ribulose-5-phosphate 4-epimerase
MEVPMLLVACHGPFTWGESAEAAVVHSAILEVLARTAWLTLVLEPGTPDLKKNLLEKHYQRKHGRNAYYGQD